MNFRWYLLAAFITALSLINFIPGTAKLENINALAPAATETPEPPTPPQPEPPKNPSKNIFGPGQTLEVPFSIDSDGGIVVSAPGPWDFVPASGSHHVVIEVFNLAGQKVKTIFEQEVSPGSYQANWDGRNSEGSIVASDVYVLVFKVDGKLKKKTKIIFKK